MRKRCACYFRICFVRYLVFRLRNTANRRYGYAVGRAAVCNLFCVLDIRRNRNVRERRAGIRFAKRPCVTEDNAFRIRNRQIRYRRIVYFRCKFVPTCALYCTNAHRYVRNLRITYRIGKYVREGFINVQGNVLDNRAESEVTKDTVVTRVEVGNRMTSTVERASETVVLVPNLYGARKRCALAVDIVTENIVAIDSHVRSKCLYYRQFAKLVNNLRCVEYVAIRQEIIVRRDNRRITAVADRHTRCTQIANRYVAVICRSRYRLTVYRHRYRFTRREACMRKRCSAYFRQNFRCNRFFYRRKLTNRRYGYAVGRAAVCNLFCVLDIRRNRNVRERRAGIRFAKRPCVTEDNAFRIRNRQIRYRRIVYFRCKFVPTCALYCTNAHRYVRNLRITYRIGKYVREGFINVQGNVLDNRAESEVTKDTVVTRVEVGNRMTSTVERASETVVLVPNLYGARKRCALAVDIVTKDIVALNQRGRRKRLYRRQFAEIVNDLRNRKYVGEVYRCFVHDTCNRVRRANRKSVYRYRKLTFGFYHVFYTIYRNICAKREEFVLQGYRTCFRNVFVRYVDDRRLFFNKRNARRPFRYLRRAVVAVTFNRYCERFNRYVIIADRIITRKT